MKRYLVVGGEVMSVTDGDIHYVGARRLVDLYGVPLAECVLADERDHVEKDEEVALRVGVRGLKVLRPRWDGNYVP